MNKMYPHITADDSVWDVMAHPAFQGRGKLLFPWDEDNRYRMGMTMADVPSLLLWHTNMHVQEMVDGVNYLIDEANSGMQILYDFYTEDEKKADPSKRDTVLFYFRGRPGGAICGSFCGRRLLLCRLPAWRISSCSRTE